MAISFLQKMKLGLRGWSRRRAAESTRKNEEFLSRQTGWGKPPEAPARPQEASPSKPAVEIDLEGLQVAYLDDSGKLEHFLDAATGEVLDVASTDTAALARITADGTLYRRVPRRSTESDAAERHRFAESQEEAANRSSLLAAAPSPGDFRKLLSQNRTLERAWYNFKNDEAMKAIDEWLEGNR